VELATLSSLQIPASVAVAAAPALYEFGIMGCGAGFVVALETVEEGGAERPGSGARISGHQGGLWSLD